MENNFYSILILLKNPLFKFKFIFLKMEIVYSNGNYLMDSVCFLKLYYQNNFYSMDWGFYSSNSNFIWL